MGSSISTHWLAVLAVVLIVFGAGRLPKAMGELARGVRAFRIGMRDDPASRAAGEPPAQAPPAAGER